MIAPVRELLMGLAGLALLAAGPVSPPEPQSYRMGDYRSPTPASLRGADVLSTTQAGAAWRAKSAVFIVVLPQPPRPARLPAATIWTPKPRLDIRGRAWLPDTGYDALAPKMRHYFDAGLEQASGGERARRLVFHCLADCWMSWNAAKRALESGWTNVAWYPDGTDGWEAAGLPLEQRMPAPRSTAD